MAFADSLVPSAGERHAPPGRHAQLTQAPKSSGCNLSGEWVCVRACMCVCMYLRCIKTRGRGGAANQMC